MTATKDGVYFGLYCYLVEGDETLVGGITWWGFFLVGGMSSFSASVGKWGGECPPLGKCPSAPLSPTLVGKTKFTNVVQLSPGLQSHCRDTVYFLPLSPYETPGAYLTNLRRMKG